MNELEHNVPVIREGSGEPLVLLHYLGVDHHFRDFPGAELSWIAGTRHASVLEKPREALALMKRLLQN